jgi:hypothetical protein
MRHPAKTDFFQAKHIVKDLQTRRLSNREVATKPLHELSGLSSSIDPIAPAKSIVKSLLDMGGSNGFVLLW